MRFIQVPLGYPSEYKTRPKSLVINQTLWQPGIRIEGQQQHKHHAQPAPMHPGAHSSYHDRSWLPVRVYEAQYTAQLMDAGSHPEKAGRDCAGAVDMHEERNSSLHASNGSSGVRSSSNRETTAHTASTHGAHHKRGDIDANSNEKHSVESCADCRELRRSTLPLMHGVQVLPAAGVAGDPVPPCKFYQIARWSSSQCPHLKGMWSEYYKAEARQPDNTQLAPWVLKRYRKYKKFSEKLTVVQSTDSKQGQD